MGTAGASESKLVDAQAGLEIAVQLLLSGMSAASLVHDIGFLDCADIGSLPLVVMADEVIGMVQRVMAGVQINQETIMLDLIEQVGPGGHFLAEERSARLCRREVWVPSLLDRDPYVAWGRKGAPKIEERARAKVQQLLSSHNPKPLPVGVQQEIDKILEAAENRVGGGAV